MRVNSVNPSNRVAAAAASPPQRGNLLPLREARSSPRFDPASDPLARHFLRIDTGESPDPGEELIKADSFVKLLDSLDSSQQQELIDKKLRGMGREKGVGYIGERAEYLKTEAFKGFLTKALDVGDDTLTLGILNEQFMFINRLEELNNTQQELLIEKIFQSGTLSHLLVLIDAARSQETQDFILCHFHKVQNLSFSTVALGLLQAHLTMLPDSEWKNGLLSWLKAYRRIEAI